MIHPDVTCSTVVATFEGATFWEHRCVSKDRLRALTITYSPDVKAIAPPIFHSHAAKAPDGFGFDDCDVVTAPCIAELSLVDVFEIGSINRIHSGQQDPGIEFWRMMIGRLEAHTKAIQNEQDREQHPNETLPIRESGSVCCEASESDSASKARDERVDPYNIRNDARSIRRNERYWQEDRVSGTTNPSRAGIHRSGEGIDEGVPSSGPVDGAA